MEYLDEELLEAKRKSERQKCTTLETGMYAGEGFKRVPMMLPMDKRIVRG